jgi:hypothetical protein
VSGCAFVRGRLTEHALGVLAPKDTTEVERHLAWCAACRKESAELGESAAILAFGAEPAEPAVELEDRVVDAVRAKASPRHAHGFPRRGRTAVAAMIAAMLAVSGLGWGAVMAGRAARFEERAESVTLRSQSSIEEFQRIVTAAEFSNPEDRVFIGQLSPGDRYEGGGAAMTLVSPSIIDLVVVMVNGVPPEARGHLPYAVTLQSEGGNRLTVGQIVALDSGGAATISGEFNRDLSAYTRVVVADSDGRVVMSGMLGTEADVASPTP